jgi:predicted nucleic acid-binding protein
LKKSVYIETTIPSYYLSRPSRDIIVLAHQEITRVWWEKRLTLYRPYISQVVIEEIKRGDESAAKKRLELIAGFEILEATTEIEKLASRYMGVLNLPAKAIRDAAHLAFACMYHIDFLVTWNCTHLANAEIIRTLGAYNLSNDIPVPIICTPEIMIREEEDE